MTMTNSPVLTDTPMTTDFKHAGPGIRLGSWLLDALLGLVTLFWLLPSQVVEARLAEIG